MTAETPGCGSNSEARKRLEQAADPHAGCTPGTCRQTEQWRSVSCTDQPIAVEVPRDVSLGREEDLLSRLACVLEATYWDRPYDTRIAAIRGMCDLTTNGMTPAPMPPDEDDQAVPFLCSQCGELESVMVKIGTSDGWCTQCLDEAAWGEREGETVTEWGVLFTNGNVFQCGSEEGAVSLALNPDDRAVARQRIRFRDVVTDWSPVTPDGDVA